MGKHVNAERKMEAINRYYNGETAIKLEKEYGLAPNYLYRWIRKYEKEGFEGLTSKSGKARYIGCSAMYAYQLLKANMIARQNNWTEFISIQNHYNIIYREDERELEQLIEEEGMSMTPYSPLAAGRVCRMWDDDTLRSKTDKTAPKKYDDAKEIDLPIVKRIKEVADKMGVSMAQVSLAWLLSKKCVAAPIVGCTKISQLEDLVKAVKIKLSDADVKYLEELYKPHNIVGALKKGVVPDVKKNLVDKK